MRDGSVDVGSFEVEEKGRAEGGEAQAALQAGVNLHGGVYLDNLVFRLLCSLYNKRKFFMNKLN